MSGDEILQPLAGHGTARVRFEPRGRRVRALLAGEAVADSERVVLLREAGHTPVYYFPPDGVRADVLVDSDHATHCPWKGRARYWHIDLGSRVVRNAAWSYPSPVPGLEGIAGYVAFYWSALEHWLEEDEEVRVHPRDPYVRVDALHASRLVRARLDGEVVAETAAPVMLFETGLPVRWYLPRSDVRRDLLRPSDTRTECPYKGRAAYYHMQLCGNIFHDIAWSYRSPLPGLEAIAGRICFHDERLESLEIAGPA